MTRTEGTNTCNYYKKSIRRNPINRGLIIPFPILWAVELTDNEVFHNLMEEEGPCWNVEEKIKEIYRLHDISLITRNSTDHFAHGRYVKIKDPYTNEIHHYIIVRRHKYQYESLCVHAHEIGEFLINSGRTKEYEEYLYFYHGRLVKYNEMLHLIHTYNDRFPKRKIMGDLQVQSKEIFATLGAIGELEKISSHKGAVPLFPKDSINNDNIHMAAQYIFDLKKVKEPNYQALNERVFQNTT